MPDQKTMDAMTAAIRKEIAQRKAVVTPLAVAEPAAHAMAKLSQTFAAHPDWFDIDDPFSMPWTPDELTKLHVNEQTYKADSASAEFGGGFFHYGYEVVLDPAKSTPVVNAWTLTFKSEDEAPRQLSAFSLPVTEAFSEDQFVQMAVAHCDRRLANGDDNTSISGIPCGYASTARVHILLQHHKEQLLNELIHRSAKNDPHDWRDVWMAYLLDHRVNAATAEDSLNSWAVRERSYIAWVIAGLAFNQAGEKPARDAVVVRLLSMKPDEPSWTMWNVPSWLYPLCRQLQTDGETKLCVDLCRQGAAFDPRETQPNEELSKLGAAATQPANARPASADDASIESDQFPGIEWDRLLAAVPRNIPQ